MGLQNRIARYAFFSLSFFLFFFSSFAYAQEKPDPAKSSSSSTARVQAAAKKQADSADAQESDPDAKENPQGDKDGPDQIKKRDEWFYKQRSSVSGRIPSGARFKAFQHMQRMMVAEGKLSLQPDGSYKEVAPQISASSQGSVTTSWTSIGPTPTSGGFFSPVTGRITSIAVDPSDSTGDTVLIGGADGGIWRTTDGGASWTPVGDQNPSLAMGSIAFAPSQASTVYAGTGEQASLGFDIYYGAGVLKSMDRGQTWTPTCTIAGPTCPFIGPYLEGLNPGFGFLNFGGAHISYLSVNPANPNMILVGAQFVIEGPQEGVYCSDTGGATWSNIPILPDEMATFVGFANSTVAYAALGNPFGNSPGAPNGNGIYKATTIGSTCATIHFLRLTAATLPAQASMGRIDLGIAPSDASGNTVYASIADASTGSNTNLGVFVTTNGGASWAQTSAPDICQQQCWYDNVVKVDPTNASIAFLGGSSVSDSSTNEWVLRSTSGLSGGAFSSVLPNTQGPGLPHVDVHAITLFKATNGTFASKVRAYLGNDGGIWRTDDAEASTITWTNINNASLTLTQFYPSISINASSPAIAFGGTQDNASQNYTGSLNWVDNHLCGDGASSAVDFIVPSTVYIGCATGFPINVSYQNGAVGTFSSAISGINLSDTANFIPPLASDPTTANVAYFGTTKVYQSLDAANTWAPISDDLITGSSEWLNAIAVEPGNPSVVYAGSNIGTVYAAQNVSIGSNTTANFSQVGPGILPPRAVTAIAPDPGDPSGNTAYVAVSGFSFVGKDIFGNQQNDPVGHIFKTSNAGSGAAATFTDVSCSSSDCSLPNPSDLPNIPVNDIVVDPDLPGILYTATDLGVFVGNCTASPCTWSTLGTGLPRVAVLSLRLHEPSRTLRAASHGRGVWDINLNNFSFTGPHISSISPVSANVGASSSLTLTVNGSGLTGGTVQWNGSAVTTTQVSATQLTASVAVSLLASPGTPQVSVLNGGQTSNLITFSVLANLPTITSLSPASTPVQPPGPSMNIPVQITGTNFSSNAKVLFNGAQNGIVTKFNNSTSLTATLPTALLGPFGSTNDISVLDLPPGGGRSQASPFKVAAAPPPNDNFANATIISSLTFSDLVDSSSATTESSDPIPPCATQYTAARGNTGGYANGQYHTIWYKFTPVFSANLEVDTIGSSYDTVLTIWAGTPGSFTNVACNDDIVPGVDIQSQISSVALTAGITYYIMVSSFGPPDANPIALGGKSQFNFSYNFGEYPAATLTSILPTSANSGDANLTLTLTGTTFFNGAGVQFVNSSTSYGNLLPAIYVSSTQLTTVIPASAMALPGSFLVSVVNPNPNLGPSNALPFTVNLGVYPVPTLSFISPATVIAGSFPFQLIATGSNFAPSAVLNFNGVAQTTSVAPSAQNAYAVISTTAISTPSTVQVTVSNPSPGGGPSAPLPFVITQPTVVPTISSVSPASVSAYVPTTFTINGTGFVQGATLNVGGPSGNYYSPNFVSSTQLSLPNFAVNGVGTFPIYVIDPAPAGTSPAFMLSVTQPPAPTIVSISPTTGSNSGGPITLTINGTNFLSGALVHFNGAAQGTTFISSTQLSILIDLSPFAAGNYPVLVVNPYATGTSNTVNFAVTGSTDFSLSTPGPVSTTISAGQTATFTNVIALSSTGGFSASVNLSCTLPAMATTCSVSPTSITTGQSATVTVSTTARGLLPLWPRLRFFFRLPLLPGTLVLLALLSVLLLRHARTRGQRLAGALPLAGLVLFLLLQSIGCGGGGNSQPPQTGTPAGSYTITVTGTATTNSGTLTHTTTLALVVQ